MLITVGEVKSSTVVNLSQEAIAYLFQQVESDIVSFVFENSCVKEEKVVSCSEQGKVIEGVVEGGGRAFFSGAGTEAKALSQGYKTIAQTRAGQNLMKLTSDMPYYPGSETYNMWGRLSAQWAKGTSGEVNVFQNAATGVDLQSIWRVYEYPALKANPNVTKIIFHY